MNRKLALRRAAVSSASATAMAMDWWLLCSLATCGWGLGSKVRRVAESGRQWETAGVCVADGYIQSVYTRAGDARSNRK